MRKIKEYEVTFEINQADYWQGAGVSNTKWESVFTGVSSMKEDAFEDAIEQLAMNDYDVDVVECDEACAGEQPACSACDEGSCGCDSQWYCCIYVK